jgi:hypothetical protein
MAEPQPPIPASVDVQWSSESKRVLHSLLLGLLRETDAAAAAVLGRHGVTIGDVSLGRYAIRP